MTRTLKIVLTIAGVAFAATAASAAYAQVTSGDQSTQAASSSASGRVSIARWSASISWLLNSLDMPSNAVAALAADPWKKVRTNCCIADSRTCPGFGTL